MAKIVKEKKQAPYKPGGKKTTFKVRRAPGVYIVYKKEKAVYVGFSGVDVYKALYRHFQDWRSSKQQRVTYNRDDQNLKVRVIYTNTRLNADRLEKALIIKLKPSDNIQQYWLDYELDEKEKVVYENYINEPTQPIYEYKGGEDWPF